jgi:hypothetical protein
MGRVVDRVSVNVVNQRKRNLLVEVVPFVSVVFAEEKEASGLDSSNQARFVEMSAHHLRSQNRKGSVRFDLGQDNIQPIILDWN